MPTSEDDLVAVVQVFRHGERYPMNITYPNDPYKELASEISELTIRGKQQLYKLGQYTRARYKNFLPSVHTRKDFKIFTTEIERTVISAQLYLAGLYPPTEKEIWNDNLKWNPIPTYTTEDSIFRSYALHFCPTYAKVIRGVWNTMMEEAKQDPDLEHIVEHSGINLNSYLNLGFLHDALEIQESLGLKLPEWTKKVYSKMPYRYNFLKSLVWTDQLKRLAVGRFFYELLEHFEKMSVDPGSGQKLIAYSGHDSNVYSMLNTLGVFRNDNFPVHAGSIFFELRKKNGESYVNICFVNDGKEYPIKISGDFDCALNQFRDSLKKYIITKEEFHMECAL